MKHHNDLAAAMKCVDAVTDLFRSPPAPRAPACVTCQDEGVCDDEPCHCPAGDALVAEYDRVDAERRVAEAEWFRETFVEDR